MGQYFAVANVDKLEWLDCYQMGHGAKACEQSWGDFGMGQTLLLLLGTGMGRGGGDFTGPDEPDPNDSTSRENFNAWVKAHAEWRQTATEVLGRWTGDRIVFVGDYAEDDDCRSVEGYGCLWGRMHGYLDEDWETRQEESDEGYSAAQIRRFMEERWTDISALVRPYMTANFGCRYETDTWTTRHLDGTETTHDHVRLLGPDEEPTGRLAPDMMITIEAPKED